MSNERPVTVLHVIHALGMGGAETWLMEVLRHWAKSGAAEMHFLCTSGRVGTFDVEARLLGAQIHYAAFSRAQLPQFLASYRRILRDGRYDAIHDHQGYASGWHFLMGAGYLPPVRITHLHNASYQIHSDYGTTRSRRLAAVGGKLLVRRFATHILGTSQQIVQEYGLAKPAAAQQQKQVLHCGFRPQRFLGNPADARARLREEFGWPASARIILFAGRIDRSADPLDRQSQKNAPFALNVGVRCAENDDQVRMIFAGHASAAVPVLEQQIAEAGFGGRIVFAGVRRDIETLMLGSDVLLFPSRGEGLGMVAVEAQAAALRVIASTAVPAECVVIPELVQFLSLTENISTWVEATLAALHLPKLNLEVCNTKVARSAFAIETSAALLRAVYGEPLR